MNSIIYIIQYVYQRISTKVENLIKSKAGVNGLLRLCRTDSYSKTVKVLLENKADVNELDDGNCTSLQMLFSAEICILLIEHKANLNVKAYRNETPLSVQKLRSLTLILKAAGAK